MQNWMHGVMVALVASAITVTTEASALGRSDESDTKWATHFYVDSATDSELYLYNTTDQAETVQAVLFLEGNRPHPLPPLRMGPRSSRTVSLREAIFGSLPLPAHGDGHWADGSRRHSIWGSVALDARHTGGQVRNLSAAQSLCAVDVLSADSVADTVVSWWHPRKTNHTLVVLQNASDRDATIRAATPFCGMMVEHDLDFAPRETRLIPLDELVPREHLHDGWTRFRALTATSFRGKLLLLNEARGFSAEIPMLDLEAPAPRRHSGRLSLGPADPALGFEPGVVLESRLFLANTSDQFETLTIDLQFGELSRTESMSLMPGIHFAIQLDAFLRVDAADLPEGTTGQLTLRDVPAGLGSTLITTGGDSPRTELEYSSVDPMYRPVGDASDRRTRVFSFGVGANERTQVQFQYLGTEPAEIPIVLHVDGSPRASWEGSRTVNPNSILSFGIEQLFADDASGLVLPRNAQGWLRMDLPRELHGSLLRLDAEGGISSSCEDAIED